MFFALSKTLYFLVQPLTLILVLFGASWLVRSARWKARLRLGSLFLLLLFSNEFLAKEVARWWETPPRPLTSVGKYEWGILLSGVTKSDLGPQDRIYLARGADRVTHTVLLYKTGHIQKILVSGGSSELINPTKKEADEIKQLLVSLGVPDSVVSTENTSRNTHESALEVARLLEGKTSPEQCVLITSAFHMPRSQACFEKAGWPMDTFATHFYSSKRKFNPDVLILPSLEAIHIWSTLIREWVGMIAYRIAGYI
ncbi:MAG: YdcF family protein [Cyclobacteriaceae bacterium]|jgi:uncharacterized SAM-binding protein YcdF (DUF218 family)